MREEVEELRSMIGAHGTMLSSLIGVLGPEAGAVMRGILAAFPEQEAFQSLSAREQRIFKREFDKL
ncbi:MAG: hypothetical protein F4050_15125 [Rhodospirillaceae bacterium]|nr:hypothetical protein [Rhodospirillaceae bacterium]